MAYPISKLLFSPICRIFLGKVRGMGNIPRKTPFIIVSNHETPALDAILIIHLIVRRLNKKVHFVVKPSWSFLGKTIGQRWAGNVLMATPSQVYRDVRNLILSGEIVAFFPENDIRRTENPKTGAIRLSIETKTSILPIAVKASKVPFQSSITIGNKIMVKKGQNVKAQIKGIMDYIYHLRDEMQD